MGREMGVYTVAAPAMMLAAIERYFILRMLSCIRFGRKMTDEETTVDE